MTPVTPLTRRRFRRAADDGSGQEPHPRRIRRIVLTGGPGGGKSTAAQLLAREFANELWVLPESATLLYQGGMPRGVDQSGVRIAQRAIFSVQRSLERAHGIQHPDRIQLCDRGTIDGAAYWPDGVESFFRSMGTTHEAELGRYDAVIFLRTAAVVPGSYERDTAVRTEQTEQALALDEAIHGLYADHPRLITVESVDSLFGKLGEVTAEVRRLVAMSPAGAPRT